MERDEGFPIVHPTGMISTRRHRFISPDIPSIPKQLRSNLLGVIIHDPNSYEMLNTDLTKYMMNSIVFLWGPNFEVAFFCILFFFPPPPGWSFSPCEVIDFDESTQRWGSSTLDQHAHSRSR